MSYYRFLLIVLVLSLLAACAVPGGGSPAPTPTEEPPSPPPAQATDTSAPPTEEPTEETVPPTETAALEARFGPEAQRIEFKSEDGTGLVGYYYPASVDPAPLIVLMHWIGGSNCDWAHVNLVQWLQNRGLPEGVTANSACEAVDLPFTLKLSEYPPMPEGRSFAVFAFDYRGHGDSGGAKFQGSPEQWRQDSIAAVETARDLDGVDPERVAGIGASIGADGAINACDEGCLGALAFSAGNYLGIPYNTEVERLGKDDKPAWCIVSETDPEAFTVCDGVSGEFYKKIIYEGNDHGMSFFKPGLSPDTGQNILDFLLAVFEN